MNPLADARQADPAASLDHSSNEWLPGPSFLKHLQFVDQ